MLAAGIETSSGGIIKIWRVADGTLLNTLKNNSIVDIAFAPHQPLEAAAGYDPSVQVWDYTNGQRHAEFTWEPFAHDERFVWQVAFSPDGQFLAAGADDRSIRLWSLQDKKLAKVFSYTDSVRHLSFDALTPSLVSASWDGSVPVWSVQDQLKAEHTSAALSQHTR